MNFSRGQSRTVTCHRFILIRQISRMHSVRIFRWPDRAEPATVRLVVPGGWPEPEPQELELAPLGEGIVRFELRLDVGNDGRIHRRDGASRMHIPS